MITEPASARSAPWYHPHRAARTLDGSPMIDLDGSFGEGGGQILRSSLTLALLTGQSFRLRNVRARRARPGLQPQHLTCVRAAAQVGDAQTDRKSTRLNSSH